MLGIRPTDVYAQFRAVWAPDIVPTEQRTHFFASWDGSESADGVFVDLPFGWTLEDVRVLHRGYQPINVRIRKAPLSENRYIVIAERPLHGHHELVLQVVTNATFKNAAWTILPFTRRPSNLGPSYEGRMTFAVSQPIRSQPAAAAADNEALSFATDRSEEPLLLRQSALPSLGTQAPYTLEFWMRTQGFNEVLLSTWNGDERQAYPLEFVVDASGRLLFYRGQPGQHQSMTTGRPVADGQWHHISLTNDPETSWTRLFVDGTAVDSLYSMDPLTITLNTPVALGSRLPHDDEEMTATEKPYTGLLDEMRFWANVRSASELRTTMRQPLRRDATDAVVLGFDDRIDRQVVERLGSRARQVASDLHFFHPIQNFNGTAEAGFVRLTWHTEDRQTEAFTVERSRDGESFEEVGQVRLEENSQIGLDGSYAFQDLSASNQILFYRVRQHFRNGSDQLSATIKMGLGTEQPEEIYSANLVGNFPNPFNLATTINYDVQERVHVQISVWDLSGQQISRLVDTEKEPGTYQVMFEANDLPSGTYFVRLQTPEGVQSHKMILTK